MSNVELAILYRDKYFIAVNKPAGMLVHRSKIDRHETEFVLQTLRDQIGQTVYPIHRLDKPTSGVLLFAFDPSHTQLLQAIWHDGVEKTYLAVVRGFFKGRVDLDKPLRTIDPFKANNSEKEQSARTVFFNLAHCQINKPIDKFPSARYSLIKAYPQNGRKHQIRRHLKHLSHPIIGDTAYGKSLHNHFFQDNFGIKRLLLHCFEIRFQHPLTKKPVIITAPVDNDWQKLPQTLKNALPTEALIPHPQKRLD